MKTKMQLIWCMALMAGVVFGAGLTSAGDLNPPDAFPSPTMKSLDEIPPSWHQIISAQERFMEVMSGQAVLDRETGLVWAKNANLFGAIDWESAVDYCRNREIGDRKGWRLPTVEELSSLLDMSIATPPRVHTEPFYNIQMSDPYWTSTHDRWDEPAAWYVNMDSGTVSIASKANELYVWPVRGGVCGGVR